MVLFGYVFVVFYFFGVFVRAVVWGVVVGGVFDVLVVGGVGCGGCGYCFCEL